MAEATVRKLSTAHKTERWAPIKAMFAEIDRLQAQMKQDREEIERLSAHTRANIDEIRASLDRICAS